MNQSFKRRQKDKTKIRLFKTVGSLLGFLSLTVGSLTSGLFFMGRYVMGTRRLSVREMDNRESDWMPLKGLIIALFISIFCWAVIVGGGQTLIKSITKGEAHETRR